MIADTRPEITDQYIAGCKKFILEPGYVYITLKPTIITTILGSCVSVALYDRVLKFGGMNHYLMPSKQGDDGRSSKYGNYAIFALYHSMLKFGSNPLNMTASIIGGGHTKDNKLSAGISARNIEIAHKIITSFSLPIEFESTGKSIGRKIKFYSELNYFEIKELSGAFSSNFPIWE